MSTAQIVESLHRLSDEELRVVARGLDAVFRERHLVPVDDDYGTITEEDIAAVTAEAWDIVDGGKRS